MVRNIVLFAILAVQILSIFGNELKINIHGQNLVHIASKFQRSFEGGSLDSSVGFQIQNLKINGKITTPTGFETTVKVVVPKSNEASKKDLFQFLNHMVRIFDGQHTGASYEVIEIVLEHSSEDSVDSSILRRIASTLDISELQLELVREFQSRDECPPSTTGQNTPSTTGQNTPSTTGSTPALPTGCGDGVCAPTESCGTCARDCGLCSTYQCDPTICVLPNCRCAVRTIPGDIPLVDTPMFISITWDDAVAEYMMKHYKEVTMNSTARDSNGCRIRQAFYTTIDNTKYNYVQELRAIGSEIGSHTITHGNNLREGDINVWHSEIGYARDYLAKLTGTPRNQVIGARAPFLRYSDPMFQTLIDYEMLYDSSIPDQNTVAGATIGHLLWPYTLDQGTPQECTQGLCPTKSYPGIWEIPMNTLHHLDNSVSLMDPQGSLTFLMTEMKRNFLDHYNGNRSPFGIWLHYTWVTSDAKIQFLKDFMDWAGKYENVFFANPSQILAWTRNPVTAAQTRLMPEFACPIISTPNPLAAETVCDGFDDNGNGLIDEGLTKRCTYATGSFDTCFTCPRKYPSTTYPPIDTPSSWNGEGTVTVSGNCADFFLKNTGAHNSLSWTLTFQLDSGSIGSAWSTTMTHTGNQYKFTSLSWNANVDPGVTLTGVGLCGAGSLSFSNLVLLFE
jgi:hypothetical protein